MSEQRTRLVIERTAVAAAELRELAAELGEGEDVRRVTKQYRADVRRAFARVPTQAAREVTATDPAVVADQMRRLIVKALEKLAGPA